MNKTEQTTLTFERDVIKELKENLFANYHEGDHCPICGHYVKLYKRKLTSSMAHGLVLIYRYFMFHPGEEWVHIENLFKNISGIPSVFHDTAVLRHWGLLEKKEGERDDGNPDVGYYRITEKGKQFVNNEITVSKYVLLYNNEVKGFDDETQISIKNAFGNKFNYNELMTGEIKGLQDVLE